MAEITSESIIKGMAGMSTVFLAWFFGNVIWERLEYVPQIEAQIKVHATTIAQNTKDIDKLYSLHKDPRIIYDRHNRPWYWSANLDDEIRPECGSGSAVDLFSGGGYLLLPTHQGGEFNQTDRGWFNAGRVHQLYHTNHRRLDGVNLNRFSYNIPTNHGDL